MLSKLTLVPVFLVSFFSYSQSISPILGARNAGLGNISTTLVDVNGARNNIAGTAQITQLSISWSQELYGKIPGVQRLSANAVVPTKLVNLSAGLYRFGDDLYNEHILSVGASNQFGLAALGVRVNYNQFNTEGFGSKGIISIDFGGIAEIIPQITVGAFIQNITQPTVSEVADEKLPTRLAAGFSVKPNDHLALFMEIDKDLDFDPTWRSGIEYVVHKKITIRTGYSIKPNIPSFGLGFKNKSFTFDYAFRMHQALRSIHTASVIFQVKKQ